MKLALIGYGKMGKMVEQIALQRKHEIVATLDKDKEDGNINEAEAVIIFSTPDSAVENITLGLNNNIPVICGTTGWLAHLEDIKTICKQKNGSFLYASNFSIGVNLFFNLIEHTTRLIAPYKEYDSEIEEIHHTQKLDKPSGTAISLAEIMQENSAIKGWVLDKKESGKVPINAKREEDVKGIHTVKYHSEIDSIELKHTAHTREGFALGAVIAAEWIVGKTGIFTMKDVLGIG